MEDKIEELFEYRKIPFLLSRVKKKERKPLKKKLISLQKDIYKLDSYLESNWDLKEKKLDKHWNRIYKTLAKLGFNENESDDLCKHIRKYQLHETQLRAHKMPTRLSEEYYYYYKSCDVRLIRVIIDAYTKDDKISLELSDWRYFDLITEINDDVEDIFEDQKTINGNLFNIMIYERGLEATVKVFYEKLTEFYNAASKKFLMTNDQDKLSLMKWTAINYYETAELLKKNERLIRKKPFLNNKGLYQYIA
jgi:hypothetical protein